MRGDRRCARRARLRAASDCVSAMKRLTVSVVALALALLPNSASADITVLLDAVSTATISPVLETGGYRICTVQIIGVGGTATATVYIQGSPSSSGPWQKLGTVMNPTPADADGNGGEYWGAYGCPGFLRINAVSVSANAVTAKAERRQ